MSNFDVETQVDNIVDLDEMSDDMSEIKEEIKIYCANVL